MRAPRLRLLTRGLLLFIACTLSAGPAHAASPPNVYVAEKAIREGDLETLRQQIDAGLEVNQWLPDGYTLLETAVHDEHYDAAQLLVANGAISASTSHIYYGSALSDASFSCDATAMAILLKSQKPIHSSLLQKSLDVVVTQRGEGKQETADHLVAAGARYDIEHAAGLGRVDDLAEFLDASPERVKEPTPISFAVQAGEVGAAEYLLEHGAPFHAKSRLAAPPIFVAADNGDIEMARVLLKHGASVELDPVWGGYPLFSAVREGHLEMVRFLIEQGACVTCEDPAGITILDYAAPSGNMELVNELISRGAKLNFHTAAALGKVDHMRLMLLADPEVLNASRDFGGYPIHWAIKAEQIEAVEFLLDQGARTDLGWQWLPPAPASVNTATMARVFLERGIGEHPLFRMDYWRQVELAIRFLEEGADPNIRDATGNTPLIMAMWDRKFDYARELVKHGADVNTMGSSWNRCPIRLAVQYRHEPLIDLMLEHGADIDYKPRGGQRMLAKYAEEGDAETVELLLRKGGDVMREDGNNGIFFFRACHQFEQEICELVGTVSSPLILAMRDHEWGRAKELLEQGATPHVRDTSGWIDTPLHLAAEAGNLEMVKLLLEKGASPDVVNELGDKPYVYLDSKQGPVAELLRKVTRLDVWDALQLGDEELLRERLAIGDSIFVKREYWTLMHRVARGEPSPIDQIVIDHVLENDPRDPQGNTVVHQAIAEEEHDTLRGLVKAGVNLNALNRNGSSPLVDAYFHHDLRAAYILLKGGADPNQIYSGKDTLLTIAAKWGEDPEFVSLLLENGADLDMPIGPEGIPGLHRLEKTFAIQDYLSFGADPNVRDASGYTVLHHAVLERNIFVMKALLENGADPAAKVNGKSALDLAQESGNKHALPYLKRALDE